MIPADAKINESVYLKRMKKLTRRFRERGTNEGRTLEEGQVGRADTYTARHYYCNSIATTA